MPTVYEVNSDAQIDDQGTHIRTPGVEVTDDGCYVPCTWGWVNSDGEFVQRKMSQHPDTRIKGDDLKDMFTTAKSGSYSTIIECLRQAEQHILDWIDANDKWATQ